MSFKDDSPLISLRKLISFSSWGFCKTRLYQGSLKKEKEQRRNQYTRLGRTEILLLNKNIKGQSAHHNKQSHVIKSYVLELEIAECLRETNRVNGNMCLLPNVFRPSLQSSAGNVRESSILVTYLEVWGHFQGAHLPLVKTLFRCTSFVKSVSAIRAEGRGSSPRFTEPF